MSRQYPFHHVKFSSCSRRTNVVDEHISSYSLSDLSLSLSLQVSDFIESLPGCEEQAKLFRDEVR